MTYVTIPTTALEIVSFAEPYERIVSQLSEHSWPARQASLPFALAEAWNIPCAYERSAKLSHGQLLANRFLLAFDADDITPQHVRFACEKLSLPSAVVPSIAKRLSRASQFMMGCEDTGDGLVMKVYLELRRVNLSLPRSLIGWKQLVVETPSLKTASACRTTFYRPLRWAQLESELEVPTASNQPSARLLSEVLQKAHAMRAEMICLQVLESTGRVSQDWNVYAANLPVGHFAHSIVALAEHFRIDQYKIRQWLDLCSAETLGHISAGIDAQGDEFITLYYSAQPQL